MKPQQSAKILTIDDEPLLQNSIITYLEDSGFEVFSAENATAGLSVYQAKKPDLVLTDLQMPGMNGHAVVKAIRQDNPNMPVIVVSGAGQMQDAIAALRLGAWDYITKPISDLAVLEHAIRNCLERSRLLSENEKYRENLERNLAILEEDQKAAKSVQERLLPPRKQTLAGYEFDYFFKPSLYVSGDFVDFFQFNEKTVCFYLADVSGHGASSAFVTILLKSIINRLRVQGAQTQPPALLDPNLVLQAINSELYKADLGKYLTIIYGVIDVTTNNLTYALAGHYPAPVLLAEGKMHYLTSKGFPVGIQKEVSYTILQQPLPEKFCLLAFSDGVLEVIDSQDSMEAKEAHLLKLSEKTQGEITNMIEALDIEKKTSLLDDITLLSIRKA